MPRVRLTHASGSSEIRQSQPRTRAPPVRPTQYQIVSAIREATPDPASKRTTLRRPLPARPPAASRNGMAGIGRPTCSVKTRPKTTAWPYRVSRSMTACISVAYCQRRAARPSPALRPARELAPLLEHAERARGARHEEPVAARDQALDVLGVRVRMAARHAVVLADLENAVDRFGHHRVLVLARVAELLAQVSFTDQHHADALDPLEDARQVLDRLGVLALDDRQDLALRRQRPHVGPRVVLALREPPVARRSRRRVAADAGRIVQRGARQARIAAGADGVARLLDGADVREDDAEHADVEHLLGDPLIHLAAVRRNAHERRHLRRERPALDELAAVQHVLERVAQHRRAHRRVLHLERDAVEGRAGERGRGLDVRRGEAAEGDLPLLQGLDDAVETRDLGRGRLLPLAYREAGILFFSRL